MQKSHAILLLALSLLGLSSCAPANHEVGMCSYMGVCPEPEGCHDGYKDDGTECDESITGNGGPKPDSNAPDHSYDHSSGMNDNQ